MSIARRWDKRRRPLAAAHARGGAVPSTRQDLPGSGRARLRLCLIDYPVAARSRRAICRGAGRRSPCAPADAARGATVIGASWPHRPADAAFANAVMGHGLVREDMHAGSISHHGIVVWPTLLALAQYATRQRGATLLPLPWSAYEAGAQIGRAVIDAEVARLFRPTGIVGAGGAALAGRDCWACRDEARDQRGRARRQYVAAASTSGRIPAAARCTFIPALPRATR